MRGSSQSNGDRSNALWGRRGESRSNALWGSGSGSGKRSNALWGRGGRRATLTTVAALSLVLPFAATAGGGKTKNPKDDTFVAPGLVTKAAKHPGETVHIIVQSNYTNSHDAEKAFKAIGGQDVRKQLDLIGAVAVDIKADKLDKLAKFPGLTITLDAPVRTSEASPNASPNGILHSSKLLWPYRAGLANLWGDGKARVDPPTPTIAIVDSGIEANRADFGSRVLPQVTITTRANNSPGDGRGHGTFVAGMAAGDAPGYTGASPQSKILPIDVMDDAGVAYTSDVIAACQFILANKGKYNIGVANFSLHSGAKNHFYNDPLDRAVEKLWFGGIFVVVAAGNYGSASGPSGVLYAPGNDPFVMTVGAVELGKSARSGDNVAPWSAYGYTEDGFSKPDVGAPGRYLEGPVPMTSTLAIENADHITKPGYIELSGTSFAAPIVAGAGAQLLARHSGWTPDQIKGALMLTAKKVSSNSPPLSAGVGEVSVAKAAGLRSTPPSPNQALNAFRSSDGSGSLSFDSASWNTVVKANASWADASWADASWADASWSSASWADASWASASWADASWADASWADASWADASYEDAAEGDAGADPPALTAEALAELQTDPDLALPDSALAELMPTLAEPAPPPIVP